MDQNIGSTDTQLQPKKKSWTGLISVILLVVLVVIVTTQITFFSIQPIGAIPDGVTLVMLRGEGTKLFDSADAMCERIQGGVNLLCRGLVLGQIAEKGTILLRLPYIDVIYSLSTGGVYYEN